MKDLVDHGKARSVILIAGGMGEKEGGASIEDRIRDLLAEGRRSGKTTPVVNGGNCLGVVSKPGLYDTLFIPDHKLPRPKEAGSATAMISQSGAFMICRMSKLPSIEPVYSVSLGNQLDLTASDYLNCPEERPQDPDLQRLHGRVQARRRAGLRPGHPRDHRLRPVGPRLQGRPQPRGTVGDLEPHRLRGRRLRRLQGRLRPGRGHRGRGPLRVRELHEGPGLARGAGRPGPAGRSRQQRRFRVRHDGRQPQGRRRARPGRRSPRRRGSGSWPVSGRSASTASSTSTTRST